ADLVQLIQHFLLGIIQHTQLHLLHLVAHQFQNLEIIIHHRIDKRIEQIVHRAFSDHPAALVQPASNVIKNISLELLKSNQNIFFHHKTELLIQHLLVLVFHHKHAQYQIEILLV